MDTLTDEILRVCVHLSDQDKVHLSATSKRLSNIKFRILFLTKMFAKDIINLSYFNRFSNVIMSDTKEFLPKHVTHLTFSERFNQAINGCIPKSVKNLTFGYGFNQSIDSMPNSVVNISLRWNYGRKIGEKMLPKVTIRK